MRDLGKMTLSAGFWYVRGIFISKHSLVLAVKTKYNTWYCEQAVITTAGLDVVSTSDHLDNPGPAIS